jgi:hypothetical protein
VPGGSVWPAGAVKLTTGSALFRDSPIFSNTQYGDATLRSGYWKDVAAHGGTWHVLFDRPVTRPLLKVHVPSGQGTITLDGAGNGVALVNSTWLTKELSTIAKTVPVGYLVALLTYNVVGCTNYKKESTCGVAGFHGWAANPSGTHVLAWASWDDTTVFADGESSTGLGKPRYRPRLIQRISRELGMRLV